MAEGLISTIIPVYNRPALLKDAVASVLGQTYSNFEIIIVDDGSDHPDMVASLEECQSFGAGKLRVLRQANRGPGAARQTGLEHANGEFVQFLDSDDLLFPGKFGSQVQALRDELPAGVCYGKTRYRTKSGELIAPWRRTGERIETLFPSMLAQRWWGTSTPLYRRNVLDAVGPIRSLVNEEDWEFDCRIAAQDVRLAWVDEWVSEQRALADNRASAGGSSDPGKLKDRAQARHLILQSALRAGVPPSTPEFQAFINSSFLLARQCAVAGLVVEAEELIRVLNSAAPRRLMEFYLVAGKCVGYQRATRVAERVHGLLRGKQAS